MDIFERLAAKNGIDKKLKVEALKNELAKTDYEAIKFAEGWISAEEYEPIKQMREELRNKIRELEN